MVCNCPSLKQCKIPVHLFMQYPITWEGLLKLLDDVQLNDIADQLEEAAQEGADL